MALSGYQGSWKDTILDNLPDPPHRHPSPGLPEGQNVLPKIPYSTRLAPIVTVPFPRMDQEQSVAFFERYASSPSQHRERGDGKVGDFQATIPNNSDQHRSPAEKPRRADTSKGASSPSDTPFQFVNSCGPPVKRGAAAGSQIRAHAMRRVHQQRRIAKNQVPGADTVLGHSQTTRACLCNRLNANRLKGQATRPVQHASYISQSGHTSENPGTLVLIAHLDTPEAATHRYPIAATNAPVVCRQCGHLKLLSSIIDKNLEPTPYSGSPISSSAIDPFSSACIYINHRMHDLLNHCERTPAEA